MQLSRVGRSSYSGRDVLGQGVFLIPLSLPGRSLIWSRQQLRVLYWHIDSQSFPLDVEAFPELAEEGAYSTDEIYTREDIQQIIQYANEASPPFNLYAA